MERRYEDALDLAARKLQRAIPLAVREPAIPYGSEGARFTPPPYDGNSWWTAGFWPALMWQMYALRGDDAFLQEARRTQALLGEELRRFTLLHHDVGFMYLLSDGADFKLTGDESARVDTLHAATLLMGRFNPVGFVRAWNGADQAGVAIIDCMMNIPLLFWATRQTGDPRFARAACIHADTTLREFIRPDGSACHIVELDPNTGARVREPGGQGYGPGSSWSRGQAWALYGFTLAAINAGSDAYRHAAGRIARYFIQNIRPDGLTDCDFRQPSTPERIDNIAGAVAACGLIELARLTGEEDYAAAACRLLDGLIAHCCDPDPDHPGLLTHCTASYHDDKAGVHTNILYGDYFFVEALCKLKGTDPMLWT